MKNHKFVSGKTVGILVGTDLHVLKPSTSRYYGYLKGEESDLRTYCCQDRCCDNGLQTDVREVVLQAKSAGATRVLLRGVHSVPEIQGLPVRDISHVPNEAHTDAFDTMHASMPEFQVVYAQVNLIRYQRHEAEEALARANRLASRQNG